MDTSDFKNGVSILMDGDIYTIVEFQHVKPGKGGAFVRSKLKNLRTGATVDKRWNAGEKTEQAYLQRRTLQFQYDQGDDLYVMDMETFDQIIVPASMLGDKTRYLKENMEVQLVFHGETIVGISIPDFMELEVIETDPNFKGDTASGGGKPATLEGGAVVQVPFFINVGDRVKVDTRTDNYMERAK